MRRYFNSFKYFIKNNRLFIFYVIISLLCSLFLRIYTSGNFSFNALVFDLGVTILIGSGAYLFYSIKQYYYYLTWLIIIAIVCIINSIYYTFYSSFASFSLLASLGQVSDVGDAVIDKLSILQFVYILGPISFAIFNKKKKINYSKMLLKLEVQKDYLKKVFITGVATIIFGCLITNGGAWSSLTKQWNREYAVNHFGIAVYQINDFFNTLKPTINSWFGYDTAYKKFTDYYENNTIKRSNNEYTNIYKGKNLVFVHMESIMTFLIDLKINNVEITPNLNKLAKEGMFFSNFYPQISVGTSSDTEFTLSTSLMPSSTGTVFVSYYDREYPSIQKLFRDNGYYTFSMHGNKASMWNRDKMHKSLGYKDFYSMTSYEIDEIIGLGLSDKSFFNQSMNILQNIETNNKNYMGTIITLSNHTPFENNEEYFEQLDLTYKTHIYDEYNRRGEDVEYSYLEGTKLGDYLISAHYADEAIGQFINDILNSEYYNNTVFVFYGDHDPKLDLKEFYNYYNFNKDTGELYTEDDEEYYDYDYYEHELNRKTPLIIWSKNDKMGVEVDYPMGMIDVMPTIGNMFGIYNKYALGHDIFTIKNNNIVSFPNGNFLTKVLYYRNSKEEYKMLDLNVLSEEYINYGKEYTETIIDISNGIITHDLIKTSNNKDNAKEIK